MDTPAGLGNYTLSSKFNWIHFSDIHVGVGDQDWLWPRSDFLLMSDLERVHKRAGNFDLLIFSGDLTQQGSSEEFDRFSEIVRRITQRLSEFGPVPKLVTVPGNHDLRRPAPESAGGAMLRKFASQPELHKSFWKEYQEGYVPPEGDLSYKKFIDTAFAPYLSWRDAVVGEGLHAKPAAIGYLPGDASYKIECDGGICGVVGLNSSWLQLGAGDYEKQLHVDPRQLQAVTNDRPDEWSAANDYNLVMTHHPVEWLHPECARYWNSDINPPGRFDLHLFGHMHEPRSASIALGGAEARRSIQAASLFGLETYGDGSKQRIQGYSANRLADDGSARIYSNWPRIEKAQVGGERRIVPDSSQSIDEDTASFEMVWPSPDRTTTSVTSSPPTTVESVLADAKIEAIDFDLATIRHHAPDARAHAKVRRVESQQCLAAIEAERAVWLVSDWGMGEDGFIASIRAARGIIPDSTYRIDMSAYDAREAFLDSVRLRYATSFEDICVAVADGGPNILILDNIDVSRDRGLGAGEFEKDIEQLIEIVRDYAPDTLIFARTQRPPIGNRMTSIELRALDEADVAIYVRESELGGERYGKPDAVSILFRHTDGIPSRLDGALLDLKLVSLNDLLVSNPDINETSGSIVSAPPALVSTINELRFSEDDGELRAYRLLLALSALPQGERLTRIRRFDGPKPFHLSHARLLQQKVLIDTASVSAVIGADDEDAMSKALVVPRPVRDYVRDTMDEATARSIDRTSLELFFGSGWQSGNIDSSPTVRRIRSPICDGYEIQNASTLILRFIRRALADRNDLETECGIRLASSFIESLIKGDHFRSAASLAKDVITAIEEFGGHEKELNILRYEHARTLRMLSRHEEAREEFERLDHGGLSKWQRQSSELGLALCYASLGDKQRAVSTARRAIQIDRKSSRALQAESVIAEQIEDYDARMAELERLLAKARKSGNNTLVSNFLLTLAQAARRAGKKNLNDQLAEILKPGSKSDNYNRARAIVEISRSAGRPLTDPEQDRLLEAYHYLYQERLYDLFDSGHEALWQVFEAAHDTVNLLNLFRHSSFIWRLNGREKQEIKYLRKLVKKVKDLMLKDARETSRDAAYFVVRVTVVLGEVRSDQTEPKALSAT